MIWHELADTLLALIESIEAPPDSGVLITEALLEVPLEIQGGVRHGQPIFLASVPHTIWKTGVLPQVHMSRLCVELTAQEDVISLSMEDARD